jgi:hypothetical protein
MSFWAAGATVVAGVGGALASKPSGGSSTKDPVWLSGAKEDLVSRGSELSRREHTAYTGDRVAELSENETEASQLARTGGQKAAESMDKAQSALDGSMTEYSDSALEQYTNPYTERVLKPQLQKQNDQYDRSKAALANNKGGAWGGDRSAFAASELEKNHMEQVEEISGKAYKDAWSEANDLFFKDSARKQSAAQTYAQFAGDTSRMNTQQIQDLMATGGTERLLKQAGLDADYAAFLEARDWDVNNLDTLIQAIGAAGGNTTTTKTGGSSGAIGTALGAGATLAGLYFQDRSSRQEIGTAASGMAATAASELSDAWKQG